VSAVFGGRPDAERAVDWLRSRGVREESIGILARRDRFPDTVVAVDPILRRSIAGARSFW
jgi:hypothetical protein